MLCETLLNFCDAISDDARITPRHVSLYVALLHTWHRNAMQSPFEIVRNEVMIAAKISARFTYNKCMNELQQFGYIKYMPTSDPRMRAKVNLIEMKM